MTEAQRQQMWACAMMDVADEVRATLGALSSEERRMALARVSALGCAAEQLMAGLPESFDPFPPLNYPGGTAT